jgi:transposase InsO family protein
VKEIFRVSERRAWNVIGQYRATQRYGKRKKNDEEILTKRIVELASKYGRYGYRRITYLLKLEGWKVNVKRIERIWRLEGLKVPQKQPKRGRLWLNDGSCIRHRPTYKNHVWSYDFVMDRTNDGKSFRILNIIDEYSRECMATMVKRSIKSFDVMETLAELFIAHGAPAFIRSDNGSEFIAENLRSWLNELNVKTLFIEPGSPWENGYVESFNGKLRDEFLDREVFYTLKEAKVLTEMWRKEYNTVRPHSSLGGKPPAPLAILPSYEVQKKIYGLLT